MERLYNTECDIKSLSPLTLAFIGDGVFDLFVRERLVCQGNCPVNKLHGHAVQQVCCSAQAKAVEKISDLLTEQESEIFRRGRNAHTNHLPKNASPADYHAATGLECLFGWLYLQGRIDRLRQLFSVICE